MWREFAPPRRISFPNRHATPAFFMALLYVPAVQRQEKRRHLGISLRTEFLTDRLLVHLFRQRRNRTSAAAATQTADQFRDFSASDCEARVTQSAYIRLESLSRP